MRCSPLFLPSSAHGTNPGSAEVRDVCEQHGIPLTPFFSLLHALPRADTRVAEVARRHSVTEARLHVTWLLHKSPWILSIPDTSRLTRLRENLAAAAIRLSAAEMAYLE